MRVVISSVVLVVTLVAGGVSIAQDGRKVNGVVVAAATEEPVINASVQYEESGGTQQTTLTDMSGYFEFPQSRLGVVTVTAREFGTTRRRWPPRSGSQLRIALSPPATVQGTVTDMVSGRLVDGSVTVFVRHPDNFVSATALSENGTFRIDDLPPGPAVIVVAHADGFAPYVGELTLEAGKPRDARVRVLLEGAATGRVVDEGGPVRGAQILAGYSELPAGEFLEGFIGGRMVTDVDGNFALHGLVPDTPVIVRVMLDGRTSDVITITVGPGTIEQGILLMLPGSGR